MTALLRQSLSKAEARRITDQVKRDAETLWQRLVLLYEGGAHTALKYPSWGAYCDAEFGMKESRAYQLLDAGRVAHALDSTMVERLPNERQARELAPLRDEPEQLQEAWAEVQELHAEPTAANVREVVQRKVTRKPKKQEVHRDGQAPQAGANLPASLRVDHQGHGHGRAWEARPRHRRRDRVRLRSAG